jgi:hypothetical protein
MEIAFRRSTWARAEVCFSVCILAAVLLDAASLPRLQAGYGIDGRLRAAAYQGNLPAIERLVRQGADPYRRGGDGADAFMQAAKGYMRRRHLHGMTGSHPELDRIEQALDPRLAPEPASTNEKATAFGK